MPTTAGVCTPNLLLERAIMKLVGYTVEDMKFVFAMMVRSVHVAITEKFFQHLTKSQGSE
ncbi:MAG: hypothetical protein WAZ77_09495 [Candidatus Nitrosopolaris sp.]